MPTTETITIPGPTLAGKPRAATITVQRHRTAARVSWDVGGIDVSGPASEAFARRLERAGVRDAVLGWLREHTSSHRPRPRLAGSVRWGHVRNVPVALAGELAELVAGFYRAAVVDLSLEYPRDVC